MYVTVYDTLEEIFENISRKKRSWNNLCLREGGKSLCVWYLWNLKTCENGEMMSSFILYKGQERSEIYLTQTLKENVVHWIKISPWDAQDAAPPKIINDASWISKRQKQ